MTGESVRRRVVQVELLGFAAVVALVWVDEVLDLPHHLLGAPATPVNWRESLFESVCVVAFAVVALRAVHRVLGELAHLEGFLPVCPFCHQVRVEGSWMPFERYFEKYRGTKGSGPSACPACARQNARDFAGDRT